MNDRFDQFMRNFPSGDQIMEMEPEELGPYILRNMMQGGDTNRFNFASGIPNGPITQRFMEAWSWLEREGFLAHAANDINGLNFFVTRAGQQVAKDEDFEARRKAAIFPEGLDPASMRAVKPLFL